MLKDSKTNKISLEARDTVDTMEDDCTKATGELAAPRDSTLSNNRYRSAITNFDTLSSGKRSVLREKGAVSKHVLRSTAVEE